MWKASCDYGARLQSKCNLIADKGNTAPFVQWWTVLQACFGSFLGILTLSGINYHLDVENSDLAMITGSFGAQAVLIFAAPASPLAQPWNCCFGNLISAFIGVSIFKLFKEGIQQEVTLVYLASAIAVSLAIGAMMVTRSLHAPAGATSLIAVVGSDKIHHLGYLYLLVPVLAATLLHVTIGVLLNNLSNDSKRMYPVYWSPMPTSSSLPPPTLPTTMPIVNSTDRSTATVDSKEVGFVSVNSEKDESPL